MLTEPTMTWSVRSVPRVPERAGPAGDRVAARRFERRDPTAAERLLELQHGAGNRAVARYVTGRRTLARMSVDEVAAECQQDAQFARDYRAWLADKVKATGANEAELVQRFTLTQLKEVVEQARRHNVNAEIVASKEHARAEAHANELDERKHEHSGFFGSIKGFLAEPVEPLVDLRKALTDQLRLVGRSPTLKRLAGKSLGSLPAIVDGLQILHSQEFEKMYFDTFQQRGLTVQDALGTADFAVGYTVDSTVCLRFGSGANLVKIHPAVHEVIHALAHRMTPMMFGQNLNEGMTETITRIVMAEVGPNSGQPTFWKIDGSYYASQRAMIDDLLQEPSVKAKGMEGLMTLYFDIDYGDGNVLTAVRARRDQATTRNVPVIQ